MESQTKVKFPMILKLYKYEIERLAQKMGLDFHDVMYEIVDYLEMSEVVARHGFPVMPHHWSFGQDSIRNKQSFKHGMSRFFEIVINSNPIFAFLLDSNELYDQKAVTAHVCGHAHIFKNSFYSQYSNPDIDQVFAQDATMMEEFCREFGAEQVKRYYDYAMSIANLFDPMSLYIKRPPLEITQEEREESRQKRKKVHKLKSRFPLPGYMEDVLNPPEWIEEQKKRLEEEEKKERELEKGQSIPAFPMKDVLLFFIKYAPLEGWQRSVLEMVRRHQYYFSQLGPKFIHEGFASVIEEELMFALGESQDKDLFRWTSTLAKVQRKSSLNPYKLLYEILLDVKFRWDTGRHGQIWENCEIASIKPRWNEFTVFHNSRVESCGDKEELKRKWKVFSRFVSALKSGRLGFPERLFAREGFTEELLIPAWVRFNSCEKEIAYWRERLKMLGTLGIEEKVPERVKELREKADNPLITDQELSFKARRDLYFESQKAEFYLWTPEEIKREIAALEPLCQFKKKIKAEPSEIEPLEIPADWLAYSEKFDQAMPLGIGKAKMLEVAVGYDDYNVLDEFFTKEFCEKQKYFLAKAKTVWPDWSYPEEHYVIESRSFKRIKKRLLFQFTNFHTPDIKVESGNYSGSRELYLKHYHSGVDLDWWSKGGRYIRDVLQRVFVLWGGEKTVRLETIKTENEEERPWWFDWHSTEQKDADEPEELLGMVTVFCYGHKNQKKVKSQVEFWEEIGEKVAFKAPF